MDSREFRSARRRFWTVAVDARLRGWDLRVCRLIHGSVTVLAIHLEFASMQSVAERNGLERSVARVESFWARYAQKQDARVGTPREDQNTQQGQKLVGPSGE